MRTITTSIPHVQVKPFYGVCIEVGTVTFSGVERRYRAEILKDKKKPQKKKPRKIWDS